MLQNELAKSTFISDCSTHQKENEWISQLGFMRTEIASFFATDMNTYQVVMTLQKGLQFATERIMKDRQSVPQQAASALLAYICGLLHDLGFTGLEQNHHSDCSVIVDELCRFRSDVRQTCLQGNETQIRGDVLKLCDLLRMNVGRRELLIIVDVGESLDFDH